MIDPDDVPEVTLDETLARYIVAGESTKSLRKLVRADETVKPQLFLPYSYQELSVNRHRDCAEHEIWQFGEAVATSRGKKLHGRSDITVSACNIDSLDVIAKPIKGVPNGVPDNPNHADVVGYPTAKEDQMSLAEKLAAKATNRIGIPK